LHVTRVLYVLHVTPVYARIARSHLVHAVTNKKGAAPVLKAPFFCPVAGMGLFYQKSVPALAWRG
jgi:hypothetical protein